ncbi:hypothetical protein SARC_01849 [Sphaeroforma arctica JP610]|uniref:Uncharacterized protein n=2 Tax=Sphaeroforma arctica JP610 TaxID=667725 RepID=A0A0L0GAQ9_9EUKA|nr:hypothetical protein SARC_01849 [Sphaeroforma arctica JP610]KNC86004.1 hypothetical protein SARC_01849 [Sphaeroforma arctica JP610]|eukprot:XP_014159906.1 hypothetical protein SARC_01849 [Sphaeroforma arctica JP610]
MSSNAANSNTLTDMKEAATSAMNTVSDTVSQAVYGEKSTSQKAADSVDRAGDTAGHKAEKASNTANSAINDMKN